MENNSFKSLDQGLAQLEAVVQSLEDSNLSIDEAIEKYAQGMELAVSCRKSLNDMSQRVTEVRNKAMQNFNMLEAQQAQKVQAQQAPQAQAQSQVLGQGQIDDPADVF